MDRESYINELTLYIFEQLKPQLKPYERRYFQIDPVINSAEDFYQEVFFAVREAVINYCKQYNGSSAKAALWKLRNGMNGNRMKLASYVQNYLKKLLNISGLYVQITRDGRVELITSKEYIKKKALLNITSDQVKFVRPEIPFSSLSKEDNNFDPSFNEEESWLI